MDTSTQPHLSRWIVEQVARWRYEDLPPAVVDTAKSLILDTLGVIGGANGAPGIGELHGRASRWERTGTATALLTGAKLSPPTAAMANGSAAHALDFDDVHDPARVHTSAVVLPTLLATAEDAGPVTGRDFLLAMAIGAELHARLGLACEGAVGHGWHPTMIFGVLAAAVAAARLLKLDPEAATHALGLAYHQAGGSAQSMRDGVLSKRLGPGFAARSAVLAAFLAADGISGTRHTFDGSAGLFPLYERNEVRVDVLTDSLGTRWRVPEFSFKPYPCCRCNHAAIDLALALHRDGLRAEDVASLEIRMGEVNRITVGMPYDASREEIVHAQFNAPYSVACAIVRGRVDLRSYQRPAITDPAVAAFASRVAVRTDDAVPRDSIDHAVFVLRRTDGRVEEHKAGPMSGSPQRPLTREELLGKFRSCLEIGLGARQAQADRLAEVVFSLERSEDVGRDLVAAFPRAGGG